MSGRNKVLIIAIIGILTVGIAFGAMSIANAGNRPRSGAANAQAMKGYGIQHKEFGSAMGRGHEEIDELADFIGISEDELISERKSGKSLAEIAQENGKTVDQLKSFLTKEFNERMNNLLKEGKITQEQYENAKSHFEERINEMISRKGVGGPNWAGGHRGCRGFGGFHMGDSKP